MLFRSLAVSSVAAIVVPIVVYSLTSVPKEPRDNGGFGVPGFTAPADPTGSRAKKAQPPRTSSLTPRVSTAQAF